MNGNNIQKGRLGESIAQEYLKKKGYKIIETNRHYSKNAEIDIIAEFKDTLVFVEVKARTNLNYGHPFEAITPSKLQKIHAAILDYLKTAPQKYKSFRFDCIAVIGFKNPTIEHLENISLS